MVEASGPVVEGRPAQRAGLDIGVPRKLAQVCDVVAFRTLGVCGDSAAPSGGLGRRLRQSTKVSMMPAYNNVGNEHARSSLSVFSSLQSKLLWRDMQRWP